MSTTFVVAHVHPADTLGRFGERCEKILVRHERVAVLLALLLFLLSIAFNVLTRPIWFDECFTLFISRLPSLQQMLPAMPADSQPPMQYLLTHVSMRLFGETELGLRLPEMLAYLAAGLLTYRIVRRHGSAGQALFAMAALLACPINVVQSATARPYGLLVFFSALVFLCWQAAGLRTGSRLLPLCGITLALAGAIFTHHLAVVDIGLFLLAGELVRLRNRRRFDLPMTAAILAGMSPLLFTLSLARQTQLVLGEPIRHAATFWISPTLTNLGAYRSMFPLPLAAIAILCALRISLESKPPAAGPLPAVPAHEWAATASLSLVLPVQMLLTSFEHGYFFPKYAVNTSLGLALLSAWGLPRIRGLREMTRPLMVLSAAAFLLFCATIVGARQILHRDAHADLAASAVSPLLINAPAGEPIVIANAWNFTSQWWYAPTALQQRLVYLYDTNYAVHQSDFVPELSLVADKSYLPVPTAAYSQFIVTHSHFLLLSSGIPRLNLASVRLSSSGWRMTPVNRAGSDVLYQVDRP